MRGTVRRSILLAVMLAILPSTPTIAGRSGSSPGKLFLWQVRSDGGVVHLLGSVHLLKKEMYPLDPAIEEAFAKSSVVVVETDVSGPGKERLEEFLVRNAFYAGDDTLQRHVSRETYELAIKELAGMPRARIDRTKPWALALTAATLEYMRMGLDPALGIDRYFIGRSRDGKELRELEAHDFVANLLNGLPDEIQDLFLFHTLTDMAKVRAEAGDVLAAWQRGDAEGLETIVRRSLQENPRLSPVHEILVSRRNRAMAEKIETYLKGKQPCFVIVGAAHLVGPDGILALLRGKGYSVEQQ